MIPQLVPVLSGGGWTPAQLGTSLLGAWDAERSDLITLVGSVVSSWRDVVAGYDAAQATGVARPAYSATSFNGRPGLTFDGADDELTYAGVGAFPVGSAGGEIWALLDQTALPADTANRRILSYGGGLNNNSRQLIRTVSLGVNRALGSTGYGTSATNTQNNLVDFSGRRVARLIVGSAQTKINVDGQEDPSPSTVTPNTSNTRTRIGANTAATASLFLQGVVNFAAITGPLTDEQSALMIQFLKARGGIA